MQYHTLLKRVRDYAGFTDEESEEALGLMVESLAVHLTEAERQDFASQLPQELQAMALSVRAIDETVGEPILDQFMRINGVGLERAKQQIKSAWRVLSEAISHGQIEHVFAQLPRHDRELLEL